MTSSGFAVTSSGFVVTSSDLAVSSSGFAVMSFSVRCDSVYVWREFSGAGFSDQSVV